MGGGWYGAESQHHLLIDQRGKGCKAFCIGGIIGQQEIERGAVSLAPLSPQTHGIHAVEAVERLIPFDAEFPFEMFQPSAQTQPARGQAEIEVGHVKAELRKFSAQEGHIEADAEEGHQERALIDLSLQPIGRQRFSSHQSRGVSVLMETDDRHGVRPIAERQPGRFDVKAKDAGSAGIVESPMLTPRESRGQRAQIARFVFRLREGEFAIVQGFSVGRESGNAGLLQETLPVEQSLLPQPALCRGPDTLQERERGGQHRGDCSLDFRQETS